MTTHILGIGYNCMWVRRSGIASQLSIVTLQLNGSKKKYYSKPKAI